MIVSHYAGLRHTQRFGDYVLTHAYARLDHVLDNDLPLEVGIPAIAEVQVALTNAIGMHYDELSTSFNQSRAIAVDIQSTTIAANGFRLHVLFSILLCVSDKPLHGEIKLPGMAIFLRRTG